MNGLIALVAAAAVVLVVLLELAAAALPLIIIITMVPPSERAELAELLASIDSSRRLRLWPTLRAVVAARRRCPGCLRLVQRGEVIEAAGDYTGGTWPTNSAHRRAPGASVAGIELTPVEKALRDWS